RFAGTVYHAAHHRHPERRHTRGVVPPPGHLLLQVGLDLLGHLLEEGRRRAAAAGARRNLGREAAQAERLEDLLRDLYLLGAVAAGPGGERDADRIADA